MKAWLPLIKFATYALAVVVTGLALAWLWRPKPAAAPAFAPVAITVRTCGRPQWVIFTSGRGWTIQSWAEVRASAALTRRYLARERKTLTTGCPGGH